MLNYYPNFMPLYYHNFTNGHQKQSLYLVYSIALSLISICCTALIIISLYCLIQLQCFIFNNEWILCKFVLGICRKIVNVIFTLGRLHLTPLYFILFSSSPLCS